jgi:hypothetical protein
VTRRPRSWRDDEGLHVDVRGLSPPEPMVTILTLVESLGESSMIAHLDRDPVFLYPELAERGWLAQRIDGDGVRVRISRPA